MSNLWDLSHIQPAHDIVMPGNTIPALFWNAVEKRQPGLDAAEKTRHLAPLELDANRRGGA
ncbi:hypothetical protein LP417_09325 [Polaromonas sp. P1-6]|nr:hypothetical protein LP417_09325 [Polaromonas sp. P1-6]